MLLTVPSSCPLLRNPIWVRLQGGALQRASDRGYVVMDEPGAVRLFIDHVAGFGHRSVALIDGPSEVDTVHRRVSAARRVCAARGIQLTARHAAATEDGGWDATTRMLRRGPLPTACGVGSLEVPVTSVSMPLAELGGAAVDELVARIERKQAGDVMIREPMRLLIRRSVARLQAAET